MKKYRNEWKYICNEMEVFLLNNKLSSVLDLDSHIKNNGNYVVHSLYFDDYNDSCATDGETGI